MANAAMTRLSAIMSFASTAWGNQIEMWSDAFGTNAGKSCRKRHEINKKKKADKARKAARKARRRNRR